MKWRDWTILLLATFFGGIVVVAIIYEAAFASSTAPDFYQIRKSVYAALHEGVNKPIEGAAINLPLSKSSLNRLAKPFPNDAHIENIVRENDWHGDCFFQFLLDLEDSAMPVDKQINSETMTATVVLNHYFGSLEKLGLRRRGSAGVVMSKIQSAQNEWFSEPDHAISVEGIVFVSPEEKQAVVIGVIRERFSKH
jgi:hypothetical protein